MTYYISYRVPQPTIRNTRTGVFGGIFWSHIKLSQFHSQIIQHCDALIFLQRQQMNFPRQYKVPKETEYIFMNKCGKITSKFLQFESVGMKSIIETKLYLLLLKSFRQDIAVIIASADDFQKRTTVVIMADLSKQKKD